MMRRRESLPKHVIILEYRRYGCWSLQLLHCRGHSTTSVGTGSKRVFTRVLGI